MVLTYKADSIAQRRRRGFSPKNQSLFAVTNRLLRSREDILQKKHYTPVNFANLEFIHVAGVTILAGLGLCLFFIISMPSRACRTPQTDAVEYAMLLLLILMLTPLSFTYTYIWFLYPLMVSCNILLSNLSARIRRVMLISFIGCVLLLGFSLPVSCFDIFKAMGNTFWVCVFLFITFGWILIQIRSGKEIFREER
ncbi:MAG: hypothetical protein MRJ65_03930 [Candidatus Brocadiaceae bacterium]|nr:hypothetical protein [Candidatus Brocadiaceae bacterium]